MSFGKKRKMRNRFSSRKAQITIFIIIGIVLLFTSATIIYIKNQITVQNIQVRKDISNLPLESQAVTLFVEQCLKETAVSGAYISAFQGGYINPPENRISTEYSDIPFYQYEGRNIMPSVNVIEYELSYYVAASLPDCINDFENILNPGITITAENISVETKLAETDINFKAKYPITIVEEGKEQKIFDFYITIPIRLLKTYEISQKIIEKEIENQKNLDLEFLMNLGMQVTIIPYDENEVIYSIYDNKSDILDEKSFVFLFASKLKNISKNTPILKEIGILNATEGIPFYKKIEAEDPKGKLLSFSDDTALFEINSTTGEINFIPGPFDTGMHSIRISATNGNEETYEIFVLNISNTNNNPIMSWIPEQSLTVNILYTYSIDASDIDGDILTFNSNSNIFKVDNETGEINITPTETGTFAVNISVHDPSEGSDFQIVDFNVKGPSIGFT